MYGDMSTALVLDRVREITYVTSNAPIDLNGTGGTTFYSTFYPLASIGSQVYYCIQNISTGEWEIGVGTLTTSSTITRDAVIRSSNHDTLVNFAAGPKEVFSCMPASAIYGGLSDLSYTFYQSVPSTQWNITHNLGKYPSVSVVDSANTLVEGDVIYTSLNTLNIYFTVPFSGTAFLN